MKKNTAKNYTLDASGKKLGRLASEIAVLLMGKDSAEFERHEMVDTEVKVENVSKLDIDEKKLRQKTYVRYTGYPGGLKKESLREVVAKKGFAEALRDAVSGMLPKNTHRKKLMKQLKITE